MSDAVILYGADGRPMKIQAVGWDSAKPSSAKDRVRSYNWTSTTDSINNLLATGGVSTMRARSREAVRNDPIAARAIDAFVANCIGSGIKPLPQVDDEDLRSEINEAWQEWCYECDADGRGDFYGLQALAVREIREGGEVFVRYRPRRVSDGLSVPLQVQLLEAEFCDSTKDQALDGGNVVRAGVEFNGIGKRVAYWMHRSHPGDTVGPVGFGSVPVPANEIAHVFHTQRAGQARGVPSAAPILQHLWELRQFQDAELVRKKLAAMMCAFQTTPNPDMDILGAGSVATASDGVEIGSLEPGTLQLLPPGHSIEFNSPADVGGSYSAFLSQQLRTIATGVGLTAEQLSGDYTQVNYSSARAALLEFRKQMTQYQHQVVIHQFCQPVFRRWFQTAVLSGRLAIPAGMELRQASRVKWVTPGWDQVDPLKEIQASIVAIEAGIKSRDEVCAERGIDPEQLDDEIARGLERSKSHGLEFTPSAGNYEEGTEESEEAAGGKMYVA